MWVAFSCFVLFELHLVASCSLSCIELRVALLAILSDWRVGLTVEWIRNMLACLCLVVHGFVKSSCRSEKIINIRSPGHSWSTRHTYLVVPQHPLHPGAQWPSRWRCGTSPASQHCPTNPIWNTGDARVGGWVRSTLAFWTHFNSKQACYLLSLFTQNEKYGNTQPCSD